MGPGLFVNLEFIQEGFSRQPSEISTNNKRIGKDLVAGELLSPNFIPKLDDRLIGVLAAAYFDSVLFVLFVSFEPLLQDGRRRGGRKGRQLPLLFENEMNTETYDSQAEQNTEAKDDSHHDLQSGVVFINCR